MAANKWFAYLKVSEKPVSGGAHGRLEVRTYPTGCSIDESIDGIMLDVIDFQIPTPGEELIKALRDMADRLEKNHD